MADDEVLTVEPEPSDVQYLWLVAYSFEDSRKVYFLTLAAAQVDGRKPQQLVADFVRAGLRKRLRDDDRVSGYVRGVIEARAQRAIEEAAETEQLVEAKRRRKSSKVVEGG